MPEATERKRTHGQWWDTNEELVNVPLETLWRIGVAGFQAGGATPEDAAFIFSMWLDKALQGDHARGMGRIPDMVRSAKKGAMDLRPDITIEREKGATALVSAGPKAHFALVDRFAMDLAVKKARQYGIGWVGAQAQGGILTPFVKQAVDQGMIGLAFTQSFPTVAPLGSPMALLGNAPVAVGIPAGKHYPIIMDLSITETSASGLAMTARQGGTVPEGAILDARGNPTTDARAVFDPTLLERGPMVARGSLRPLGGGHKGYALVFVIGLLAYLLTDTSPPWELGQDNPKSGKYGTVFAAIDPGAFAPAEEIEGRVDRFIDKVKSAPKKDGAAEILYPGERSQQLQREARERRTVAVPASHYHGMMELAKELGLG